MSPDTRRKVKIETLKATKILDDYKGLRMSLCLLPRTKISSGYEELGQFYLLLKVL
jgi:hypothetical protein